MNEIIVKIIGEVGIDNVKRVFIPRSTMNFPNYHIDHFTILR